MPAFTEIIRDVTPEKFTEIFSASTRKAREAYYHRHGVRKAKPSNHLRRSAEQVEERTHNLFDILGQKEDDEMVEEIMRTWLLSKRALLAAALDALEIQHDNGLTESDEIDGKFEKLGTKDIKKLVADLSQEHPKEDIALYLRFMGANDVNAAL